MLPLSNHKWLSMNHTLNICMYNKYLLHTYIYSFRFSIFIILKFRGFKLLGLGFWGRLVLQGLRIRVLGGHVLQRSLDSPNFAGNGWVAGHRLWRHLKLRVRPWQKIRKAQRVTKLIHQIYFILTVTLYKMSKRVWPVGTKF